MIKKNELKKKIIFFILGLFLVQTVYSQTIQGRVIDFETQKPLPFVHVLPENTQLGTTTNIDGEFEIQHIQSGQKICFRYLGYYPDTIVVYPETQRNITIKLHPKSFDLEEIVILPGDNPADRIIEKVIQNRKINNPENLESFAFTSYNKMYFTFEEDEEIKPDSTMKNLLGKDFSKHHLLFIETINEKKFLHPDHYSEKIIASKVSGFKDPIFSLITSQVQAFSFYNDFFEILDKRYLNPISKNSTKKYFFLLQDTLYNHRGDSIFVISFRPKKGKKFDGLQGFLYINTHKYAIQSVVAQPLAKNQGMNVEITQNYALMHNKHWFPKELITKITFEDGFASSDIDGYHLVAHGTSYIRDVQINPELNKNDFGPVEVQIDKNVGNKTEDYWNAKRAQPLHEIEKETYRIIDSISQAFQLEQKISGIEALMNGNLAVKCFNIPLNKIMDYNGYEGFRLGLGLMTNYKLSSHFSFGGYFGYGFKDKGWKYGGDLFLHLHPKTESNLHLSYRYDVKEKGGYHFLEQPDLASSAFYRRFMVEEMDLEEKYEISFSFLSLKYLKTNLFFNQSFITNTDNYFMDHIATTATNEYGFNEIGVQFRYAYKEKFIRTLRAKYSQGTRYPILYANIIQGTQWFSGEFNYTKYEAKISQSIKTKSLGKSKITLVGGFIEGDIPLTKIYNGHASYHPFSLEAENSFGTMRMNEFYAHRFLSVFLKHNFGSILWKTERFAPQFVLINNFSIGELSNQVNQYAVSVKSFDKGYYECGLLIHDILSQSFLGYGFGIFYRYGPYTFDKTADNFAYKLSLTIGL
jgi:hypothetical protein